MTKKKNYLLWGFALLFLGIVNSCRNDYLHEQQIQNEIRNHQLTSKIISLSKSKHKTKLFSELKKSKTFLNANKNSVWAKTVNFGDSITIDTDHVILIENGSNYHTYTFNIQRTNPQPGDPVENWLLTPLPDGSYKEFW